MYTVYSVHIYIWDDHICSCFYVSQGGMELHTRSVSTVSAIAQMTFCIHQAGHSMSGAIPCSNFCLPWNFMGTCLQAFARNVFCICMNNRLGCQVRRTCCGSNLGFSL